MKILLITGSREGWSYREFRDHMLQRHKPDEIELMVFGCAKGIDSHALRFCQAHGIKYEMFEADWDRMGKKAGIYRNTEMGDYVLKRAINRCMVEVMAFRTDISKGTTHMIKYAQSIGLNTVIYDKSSFTFL